MSPAQILALLPPHDREVFWLSLSPDEQSSLRYDWRFWARPNQLEPDGDWSVWLLMAGRGFGKTRSGAEFIREQHCGPTPLAPGRVRHTALVAETAADARDVMVKGVSGILAVHPPEFRPRYSPTLRLLEWPNGSVAHTYSAEDPEQLRGPEHDLAWSDELAKWRYAQETWDMLQFGLRSGDSPRQLVTTTPRPIPLVRELLKGRETGSTALTFGSTYDNSANLASPFLARMREKYEGTRLGRQELRAEVLDDVPGALWTRAMLDRRTAANPLAAGMGPGEKLPDMRRVVVGVDPSGSSGEYTLRDTDETSDDIGIVAAGIGVDDEIYILEDSSVNLGPLGWARAVVNCWSRNAADLVVAEVNYGGAMVESTIRTIHRQIPYRSVRASRGKVVRAEPIAALYEQGRVRHVSVFSELEDQMCAMSRLGYQGSKSPDRVDALVWAINELMIEPTRQMVPVVRSLGR